jgi:hypothetical protein
MKLKLVETLKKGKFRSYGSYLGANRVAKVTESDGRTYWIAEVNALGGVCDDCKQESPDDAKLVEIYEEENEI